MSVKSLKKQLAAAVAMVCVAAIALGSSTYAWFVNNTTVKAQNVAVTAKAANNLLIAHGAHTKDSGTAQWGTVAEFYDYDSAEFKPVSTIGTSSYANMNFFKDKAWTTDTDGKYNAKEFIAATSSYDSGASKVVGDYFKDTITLKASQASKLYLDTETVFNVAAKTGAATANDTPTSLRVALVVKGTGDTSHNGAYIYHVNKDNLTNTYNTTLVSMAGDGIKKGIATATVYDTNGTTVTTEATAGAIVGKNVDSTNGVTKYLMAGTTNTAPNLATTPSNTAMVESSALNGADELYAFSGPDDVCVIDVYIWMEGCDYDCNSSVVKNITQQNVTTTLGFCVGAAN